MKHLALKPGREKNILAGHPWIFSGAILKKDDLQFGELCEVFEASGKFIGIGYYNNTDIAVRIISREKIEINTDFFATKLKELKKERENYIKNTNAYRLVFAESDNIPGLIVDNYAGHLCIQYHTLGIEKLHDFIIEALIQEIEPKSIYLKEASYVGKKDGFQIKEGLVYGDLPQEIEICENGFKFLVNIREGQKTGFFLDQRQNRKSILDFIESKNVLNTFSYTGGFSVYAASKAKSVTSVDISAPAMEYAKKNFSLNGYDLSKHKFVVEDVFDYLNNISYGEYNVIIIDPPSLAKKRSDEKNAIKAYITLNTKALNKLEKGSILVSSSCTSCVDNETFIKILNQAAISANCQLKVLDSRIQPFDHSYNLTFPEGKYLKFYILLKN